jgi:hypothetical protein
MAYSIAGLENLWIAAGGDATAAPQAAAIAEAESSGNPGDYNGSDPSGGSYGLWQINGSHASELSNISGWQTDPLANAKAAVLVWTNAGRSFGNANGGPWQAEFIPGSSGSANYQAALAKEESGNIGDVPQLGTGSRPGAGLAGAVGQPSTTPGQTVAQQTGSQAVAQVTGGAAGVLSTLQTSWATFWSAHPSWIILAGIVLALVAWSLIAGGSTVNVDGGGAAPPVKPIPVPV